MLVFTCDADGTIEEILVDNLDVDPDATMLGELLVDDAINDGCAFVREIAERRSLAPWTGSVVDRHGQRHRLTFVGTPRDRQVVLVGTGVRPGDGSSDAAEVLAELSRANNELMDLHRQVATANAGLERTQHARDRLLAMVSHELRSPASIIHGLAHTTLARYGVGLDPQAVTLIERIMATSQRLLSLVDDLLSGAGVLSGDMSVDMAPHDVRDLVDEIAGRYRERADVKGIAMIVTLPSDPIIAMVDADRFLQVLDNLIGNAVKYSPLDAQATIAIDAWSDEAGVTVTVADEGPGIADDDLALLWEPFVKGSARPTGDEPSTGLGLAVAHEIVRAHGGSLRVETTVGEGSTFIVVLDRPVADAGRRDRHD